MSIQESKKGGGGKKGRKGGVDNTSRRTWDTEEFEKKAKARAAQDEHDDEESALDAKRRRRWERDPLHQGLIVERANLKQREFQLDLTSRLNKSQVVTHNTPLSQQAGYYCSVCDCILRDSQSYLDHINGKWHNRALGMSMRVERSNADQVRKRFDALKHNKYSSEPSDYVADGFDKRVLEQQEEEERRREEKRERKRKKHRDEEDEAEEPADPDMALAMGFAGFGGTKGWSPEEACLEPLVATRIAFHCKTSQAGLVALICAWTPDSNRVPPTLDQTLMELDWELFGGHVKDEASSIPWATSAEEPYPDLDSLPDFSCSDTTHWSLDSAQPCEQSILSSSTPLWIQTSEENSDQFWPVQELSPKRKPAQEPSIHTPPKVAANEPAPQFRKQPSVEELVQSNLAALQESAAELMSICHHHAGVKSPKRPRRHSPDIPTPQYQTRSLSASDIVPQQPDRQMSGEPMPQSMFAMALHTPLEGTRKGSKRSRDPLEACAMAPVTPAKGISGDGLLGPQPVCMFQGHYPSPFELLEPFNIVKESPLAKSTSLGELNQRLSAGTPSFANAHPMTQITTNLTRGSSCRLPNAHFPPISRRPSLTQISTQLAGMTTLTISNGVVIKPESWLQGFRCLHEWGCAGQSYMFSTLKAD
ncbi:hypothetical protein WJX74_003663 [Apatococcus lobatus]|uniref:U1-type domain-containing protein n=1 Tax=Apatococcus lobatus TaxID=904363 RepID=A0AAW1QBC3_9CHLO